MSSTIQSSADHVIINADGSNKDVKIQNNGSESVIVKSDGSVGVGTSSPAKQLHLKHATPTLRLEDSDQTSPAIPFDITVSTDNITINEMANGRTLWYADSAGTQKFYTGGSERMRVTSSGNLLVGRTSSTTDSDGFEVSNGGTNLKMASTNGQCAWFNRQGTEGQVVSFLNNDTGVGSISVFGANVAFGTNSTLWYTADTDDAFYCVNISGSKRDNSHDLGLSNARFDDVYATNGTIQTSDRNEKQDIEELNEAEQRVAVACKGLMRKFRWKSAVAEKGDEARTHFGIIAQDLQDAFADEGLDAGDYAMFISTTWWETQTEVEAVEAVAEELDEDGDVITEAIEAKESYTRKDTFDTLEEAPEGATERTRMGVRYPELLAFIISAL